MILSALVRPSAHKHTSRSQLDRYIKLHGLRVLAECVLDNPSHTLHNISKALSWYDASTSAMAPEQAISFSYPIVYTSNVP